MKQIINEENLKIIFGIKIKSYRTRLGLSLKALSKKSGIAVSYLSEIESGKKYPKPEKLISLASALEVDYDILVSSRVSKELDPFAALLNSGLVKEFPFHLFGISVSDILGLFKNNPENAHAFLQTFLQISRAYDMSLENFLFAALRTYIRQHNNYFADLENLANQYAQQKGLDGRTITFHELKDILHTAHSYVIEETALSQHPDLKDLRSVLRGQRILSVNSALLPPQLSYILAREIGFLELGIQERPLTSSWIKVKSFEQLVNNYKASYFGGALLLQQQRMVKDVREMFEKPAWDGNFLLNLLEKYKATPEMFLYRMSQLLPGVLGLPKVFYFRFVHAMDSPSVQLTKELNMTDSLNFYGLGINEHHCRRLLPLRLLKKMRQNKNEVIQGSQIIEFVESGAKFLLLSMARPLSLSKSKVSAIALGIEIDEKSEGEIHFLNNSNDKVERVSESCDRCPIQGCSERVAEGSLIARQRTLDNREKALSLFINDL